MLKIFLGNMVELFIIRLHIYDNQYEDEWITDPFDKKEMVKDVWISRRLSAPD